MQPDQGLELDWRVVGVVFGGALLVCASVGAVVWVATQLSVRYRARIKRKEEEQENERTRDWPRCEGCGTKAPKLSTHMTGEGSKAVCDKCYDYWADTYKDWGGK